MSEKWLKMYIGLHVKYPLFLFDFNGTWTFSTGFLKILKYQISWKSAHWEPSCSMRTDRHDEINSRVFAISRRRLKTGLASRIPAATCYRDFLCEWHFIPPVLAVVVCSFLLTLLLYETLQALTFERKDWLVKLCISSACYRDSFFFFLYVPNTTSLTEPECMRWAKRGRERNRYNFVIDKPDGNRSLRRPGCRWEFNIKKYLNGIIWRCTTGKSIWLVDRDTGASFFAVDLRFS